MFEFFRDFFSGCTPGDYALFGGLVAFFILVVLVVSIIDHFFWRSYFEREDGREKETR